VRLGEHHKSSNSSSSNEGNTSNDHERQGPGGQQGDNGERSLLSSVREVVVSGVHVVEGSSVVHSDQTSIEVLRSLVELVTVVGVSVDSCLVLVVGSQQSSHCGAVGLSNHGHCKSEISSIEQWGVGSEPSSTGGNRVSQRDNLNHVASVSLVSTLTSISSWVGVATGPLEVDVVSDSALEVIGDKVVLSAWVGLDDVTSLSSNVKVKDSVGRENSRRSGSDVEHVRSILEGSSKLRGINSQSRVLSTGIHGWVLSDWGVGGTIHGVVNESSIWSVSRCSQISSRNVVSNSEGTVAVIVGNAREILGEGESPVVEVVVTSISSISEMVISGEGCNNTVWGGDVVWCNLSPGQAG